MFLYMVSFFRVEKVSGSNFSHHIHANGLMHELLSLWFSFRRRILSFLRFASHFYVLSRILLVVVLVSFSQPRFVCCWILLPRAMAVFAPFIQLGTMVGTFNVHLWLWQWLIFCLSLRMSVQSLGRLEWSNALGSCGNAPLWELGLFLFILVT